MTTQRADSPGEDADRRPLRSRGWPLVGAVAAWLARRGVAPNTISLLGMAAGVGAGACLAATPWAEGWGVRALCLAAAVCIQARLLANLLDGMVAIEGGRRSAVGELYNEVPDRVSDAATLIGAGYAVLSWPALGYAAAIVAVLVAYVRAVGKGCGMGSDFRGPMAKQHRMAVMTAACVVVAAAPGAGVEVGPLDPRVWGGGEGAPLGALALGLAVVVFGGAATCVLRLMRLARSLRERGA